MWWKPKNKNQIILQTTKESQLFCFDATRCRRCFRVKVLFLWCSYEWLRGSLSLSLFLFLKLYNTIFFFELLFIWWSNVHKSLLTSGIIPFFFLRCLGSKQTHLCPRERESVVFGQLIGKKEEEEDVYSSGFYIFNYQRSLLILWPSNLMDNN